jgi:hypothetical protein
MVLPPSVAGLNDVSPAEELGRETGEVSDGKG